MNAHMFGRCFLATISAFVVLISAITGADATAATNVLLSFSSDRCGHCQAMQPTLRQLEQEGTPVRHVNVNREPDLARRHGIRQTPTYVVLSAGRELTRLVGAQSMDKLRQSLAIDPSGPRFDTLSSQHTQSVLNAPAPVNTGSALSGIATQSAPHHGEAMPSLSVATAVERARAATVRLRVYEGQGFGVGTGTVIDRHGDEALVLTCGHLFRETKLQAKIEVDLFIGGQVQTVPGQVIDYDADDKDIALVVIKPGFDVQPVPILNPTMAPQSGQSVFSFGCDRGADPSRRDTSITGINIYNQHLNASNIEIAGAPIDGRSGGGLFDQTGRLIGVCNAADYEGDVGIYTGPGSIKWQLDRIQMPHLYQTEIASSHNVGQPSTHLAALSQPAAAPQSASLNQNASSGSLTPAMKIILQDPASPNGQRILNVNQPTPELLNLIHRHAN